MSPESTNVDAVCEETLVTLEQYAKLDYPDCNQDRADSQRRLLLKRIRHRSGFARITFQFTIQPYGLDLASCVVGFGYYNESLSIIRKKQFSS